LKIIGTGAQDCSCEYNFNFFSRHPLLNGIFDLGYVKEAVGQVRFSIFTSKRRMKEAKEYESKGRIP
jgi:hypothetical protein